MKKIPIPIFKQNLWIADKEHAEKCSGCKDLSQYDAITYQTDGDIYVYFDGKPSWDTIAHESVHIANYIIDNAGLIYTSKDDELLAYLVGYVFSTIFINLPTEMKEKQI